MQLRWTLQAEGPAASVPLPALLKALTAIGGTIYDCWLSLFASLAVLNVSLSVKQGTDEKLRQKLLLVTSQTKWRFSLSPEVTDGGSTEMGPRCSSTGIKSQGPVDGPGFFCLRVLLSGHLLPSSLFAATCQVLERHHCCVLSSETQKAFPLLSSAKKRRLLLIISFRLPAEAPSNWSYSLRCPRNNISLLGADALDLRRHLFHDACIQPRRSKLNALAKLQLGPQQESHAPATTGPEATTAAAPDAHEHEEMQQKTISGHVDEEVSNRNILAIISPVSQEGHARGGGFYGGARTAKEFARSHRGRLRSWEVRLFAKSCTFLTASKRAKTSIGRDHNVCRSSSGSSSDSDSVPEWECTNGGSCLEVGERIYSLSHDAPWWSNVVLDSMRHNRGEPATGHQQLQGEEAQGQPCLVDTAVQPLDVKLASSRAEDLEAQTSGKSRSNRSSHSDCSFRNNQTSSSRITIPPRGGTKNTRGSGGKIFELLLVQQPHLTSRFVSEAAAAAEAAECHRVSSVGEFVGLRFFVLLPRKRSSRALRARLQQWDAIPLLDCEDDFAAASLCASVAVDVAAALSAWAFVRFAASKDSTLIEEEVIDEIAAEVGKKEEVAALTRSAMGGSLPFAESLKRRLSVLKGLDRAALSNVSRRLTPTQGALALCRLLKARGVFIAILSGGFEFFADELKQKLQADFTAANQLSFTQHEEKQRVLLLLSEQQQRRWQLHLAAAAAAAGPAVAAAAAAVAATAARGFNAAAIGDGSNDILMLRAAETGIAFCAKDPVKAKVPIHLNTRNLWLAAYFLGVSDPVV
ncbi:hypothetical protein ACSSS7_007089 [Eimeria intestinalis]